jgi:hypothetical protein
MTLFCLLCFPANRIHGLPPFQVIRNYLQHYHTHHLAFPIPHFPAIHLPVWNNPADLSLAWLTANANALFLLLTVNVDYRVLGCNEEDYFSFASSGTPFTLDWSHLADSKGETYSSLEEMADFISLTNEEFLDLLEMDGRYFPILMN